MIANRIRRAIHAASCRLQEGDQAAQANNGPLDAGDIFFAKDSTCFFVVVRQHLDNPDLFCVAPSCNCVLAGASDVVEEHPYLGKTVIHCGYSFWMRREAIPILEGDGRHRVSVASLRHCRQTLAHLARCTLPAGTDIQQQAESDPHYWEHCEEIANTVHLLGV